MTPLFSKLNLKEQREIVVLNAPASFEPELVALPGIKVARKCPKQANVQFAIAFVITQQELDGASIALTQAVQGDAVLWFAYPKGTSKKYTCEFNRDGGWSALGAAGFEAVRQVAIDEDWSALRFRHVDYIKSLTRDVSRASSSAGKQRVTAAKKKA